MNKILLVEDNLNLREINQINIQHDCKMLVETALSAKVAIELLQKHSYKFIVCDYKMPSGNGIDVLRYLERTESEIPFVFYTNTIGLEIETQYTHYRGIISKLDYKKLVQMLTRP